MRAVGHRHQHPTALCQAATCSTTQKRRFTRPCTAAKLPAARWGEPQPQPPMVRLLLALRQRMCAYLVALAAPGPQH